MKSRSMKAARGVVFMALKDGGTTVDATPANLDIISGGGTFARIVGLVEGPPFGYLRTGSIVHSERPMESKG